MYNQSVMPDLIGHLYRLRGYGHVAHRANGLATTLIVFRIGKVHRVSFVIKPPIPDEKATLN